MNPQHIASTSAGRRLDLLHWLLFILAVFGAYLMGPPPAFAQGNTRADQHDLQAIDAPTDPQPSTAESPGVVQDGAVIEGADATSDQTSDAREEAPEEARDWSEDPQVRDAYARHLVGSWRIDLTQFMTRQIAESGRPALAMIAGALTQELFGESYGIVTANADGAGSARGFWFGETVEGTGSWEVLAVDGEHARLRLVVPEYGIDRIFEVRREGDRVYARYQRLPAIFVRQGDGEPANAEVEDSAH